MLSQRTRVFGILGLLLVFISILVGISWNYLFYEILGKFLILRPNSLIFDLWNAPPTKITIDFYMFNWTNPEDFRNPDIKPKFEELGPYRFYETQQKFDIVWHKNNASVSYRKKSFYEYDARGSNGSLYDRIITLNSLAVATATTAKGFNYSKRLLTELAMMVYPRDLTLRKTVNELLFAGFSDTLLSVLNTIPMPGVEIPFDKYGYCYGRNCSTTYFGNYNIHTGGNNLSNIGQMHTWNFKNYSTSYPRQCSKIRGSAGEFQGPNMKINSTTNIFVREFCRDIPLEFDFETDVDGVRGYKYVAGLHAVDNGTLYPENACLCNGECLPSGVMNISSCWFNSPLFVSYPHFYKADPYYLSQVEGLRPDKEKHEFSYIVEPKTSIGMHVVARTQMNQLVRPIPDSRLFHDARQIMFPLFWAEANARLTPSLLDYFRLIEKIILCGQILAGILCVIGVYLTIRHPTFQRFKQFLLQHWCNASLETVLETEMEIKNEKTDAIKKESDPTLYFKTCKKWKYSENLETSRSEVRPSSEPLIN